MTAFRTQPTKRQREILDFIRSCDAPSVSNLRRLLSQENVDGEEITIGNGRYRLEYLRPATPEEMS